MKRALVTAGAIAAVVVPAAVAHPTNGDQHNAARECRAERGNSSATREAFALKYGTNAHHRNAFGKCVSKKAREEEAERHDAADNAAKQCKAERNTLGEQAFTEKYGTNKNGKDALGKCVSKLASKNKAAADERDARKAAAFRRAAKKCAEERRTLGRPAFAEKYGTNHHKRNAFGKCVSKLARS
jgi:superfamily II DNA helicase RecQ